MTLIGIIAIIALSLLFTSIFVFGLGAKGPWGNGWTFFIVIALTLGTVSLWVPPAGPVWYGAAWIDLIITGLLVSFILSAATSPSGEYSRSAYAGDLPSNSDFNNGSDSVRDTLTESTVKHKAMFAVGGFFWMLLVVLSVLIIVGAV